MASTPAAQRVRQFLRDHPSGPLIVSVGSASVAGIAWLADHAAGRPVELLIGDMKGRNFARASSTDRAKATEFVSRKNVAIKNWYRTNRSSDGKSEAHLKAWVACSSRGEPEAFLVGSANLTVAGLHDNFELMAVAAAEDHGYLRDTVWDLRRRAWDAKPQLLERLAAQADTEPAHVQTPSRSRQGCAPAAALLVGAAASGVGVGAALMARATRRRSTRRDR